MHFMAVKKSRKRSGFVTYSYLKDSAFTTIKRTQSSDLGIGIKRGTAVPFFSKMVYKGERGLSLSV